MQVKPVTIRDWQEFVESLPKYAFFQLPMWSQAFEKVYSNYKADTQLYKFDDGVEVLVPLVEIRARIGYKVYESLPHGGYGGLLWNKKPSDGQIRQITDHLLTKKTLLSIYLDPLGDEGTLLDVNSRFVRKETFTHLLTFSEPGDAFKSFKKYCRNRIRHAEKVGVVVSSGGIKDLDVYYQIYSESAKRWGLPKKEMYSLALFQHLVDLGKEY